MNDDAFDQILADWLREGPERGRVEALDRALAATRRTSQRPRWRQPFLPGFAHANTHANLAIRTTPQARDLRIPRRTIPMSNALRLVAVLAVIVIAGVAAFNVLRPSADVGGISAPSPTPTPSQPSPTPSTQPSPSPYAIDPATWTSYTSTRYGFTIGHPADWTVRPATRGWSFPADATADPYSTAVEAFIAADQTIAAAGWSVTVPRGTAADAWILSYCLKTEGDALSCPAIKGRSVTVTVDGHAGSLLSFGQDTQAFILIQNRMYVVAIWQPEDFIPGGVSRLLEAYVSTMHLLPGGPSPAVTSPQPS
jgi:hypothetical protein